MVLGIADDGDANPQQRGEIAFRDGFGRVIGSLCVHVRLDFAQKRFDVEFVENDHVIHGRERGDERTRARAP